ncbi:MAG: sterol desaturase family protein, partial [Flammeovirgaceae bacterium]
HNVHHSSPWMNFTTAFRLNWFNFIISPLLFIPVILLGFSMQQAAVFFVLNLFYQFFLHTEAVGKIPLIEGWLNTPSAHRVHHGSNALYIDKNYGGILMIWDRIFGTYQAETEKVNYGVTTGFEGHNPAKLVLKPIYNFFMGRLVRERENRQEETKGGKGFVQVSD